MTFPMIYAAVPRIACKGKCQASCGPIDASLTEREYFEKRSGKPFPEVLNLKLELNAALQVMRSRNFTCPYLNPVGQCDVYQNRPLICRLWGVAPEMPCPWGCKPERPMTSTEASELLRMTFI